MSAAYRSDPSIDFWQALAFEVEDWRAARDHELSTWQWRQENALDKARIIAEAAIDQRYYIACASVALGFAATLIQAQELAFLTDAYARLQQASEEASLSLKRFQEVGNVLRNLATDTFRGYYMEEP